LRAGEVVRLKVKHIDSAQKIIRIEQSKGRKDRKDRNVMLSAETLDLLRQWWKARPPGYDATALLQERWPFPGRKPGKPMTTRQLSCLFQEAAANRDLLSDGSFLSEISSALAASSCRRARGACPLFMA
jgi:integrase/recombinase XerD